MQKANQLYREICRFVIVGIFAVIIQYIVYFLLLKEFYHNIAFLIGYLVSFIFNYLMTAKFTFSTRISYRNGFGFILCHIVNFLMQVLFLNIFIWFGLSKQLAPIPMFAICVPTNFVLVRHVMKKL